MAKVPYSKLSCKINNDVQVINFNGQDIEVKQYLSIQDKLKLISRVIEICHEEDYNYSNPVKRDVYATIEIIDNYTNISFTEKQKEDVPKLYDAIYSSGLKDAVMKAIPEAEWMAIKDGIEISVQSIYEYQHSILGILDLARQDFSEVDEEASELQQKIRDPKNLDLLKEILNRYSAGIVENNKID